MDFWMIVFWLIMLLAAVGFWFGPTNPTWQRFNGAVLWLLLAILGAYAIGVPGLPGR